MEPIKVHETLRKQILGTIPKNYNNLEKAIYIYYQLCTRLEYSMDYYVNQDLVINQFTNPANAEKVDGKTNKEVVCFTFNAIFLSLLIDANLCDISSWQTYFLNKKTFPTKHQPLELKIDGVNYIVDSTYGVLDNNDLVLCKYSTHKIIGWEIDKFQNIFNYEDQIARLKKAINKVQTKQSTLEILSKKYIEAKLLDESFKNLSLDQKVKLFLDATTKLQSYSILSLNYLLRLKRHIFSKQELGFEPDEQDMYKTNIELLFAKDSFEGEAIAFLFYNTMGRIDDLGFENFEHLKIYQIYPRDKTFKEISFNDFNSLQRNCEIVDFDDYPISSDNIKMLKRGFLHVKPIYERSNGTSNGRLNVIRYERKFPDGHVEDLSIEQYQALKEESIKEIQL